MSFCTACGCERIGANHYCDGCGAEFGEPERQEERGADPWGPTGARSGSDPWGPAQARSGPDPWGTAQARSGSDPWGTAQARSGSWASGFSTTWSFTGASGPVLPADPVTKPDVGIGLLDSLLAPADPAGDAWPEVVGTDAGAGHRPPGRFRWVAAVTVAILIITGLAGAATFELGHHHGRTALRVGSASAHARTPRSAASSASAAASGHGGTDVTVAVASGVGPNAALPQVIAVLDRYFSAINQHDYAAYARLLDPQALARAPASEFYAGDGSTTDSGETLTGLADMSSGGVAAAVTFTSHQQPADSPDHSACDAWSITLYLVPGGAGYLIGLPPAGYQASYTSC